MKKVYRWSVSFLAVAMINVTTGSFAQETTVFSNIGQSPIGSLAIGNNAWCAVEFLTSTNSGGYLLDSIQLRLDTPTGTPSGLNVAVYYSGLNGTFIQPVSFVQSLTGPAPSGSGVFTFQSSGLTLDPNRGYFVVATALTPAATGAYRWDITPWVQPPADVPYWGPRPIIYQSSDGLNWTGTRPNIFEFAINVTTIPEPSNFALLGLGGSLLFMRRVCRSRARALSQP